MDFNFDDVLDIEADLTYYEKASVMFLLCQNSSEVEYFVQQLLILAKKDPETISSTIFEWARRNKDKEWKSLLIESLSIVQANHVLKKLGFDLEDLKFTYFPHRPEIVSHVKPIMKVLYSMCEQITVDDCKNLIESLSKKFSSNLSELEVVLPRNLEVHLFLWISRGILSVDPIDIKELLNYFKFNDNLELYDFLKSNIDRIGQSKVEEPKFESGNVRDEEEVHKSTSLSPLCNVDNQVNYHFNSSNPGILLIINQFSFEMETDLNLSHLLPLEKLATRKGTEKDVEILKKTFEIFNYTIIVENNLRHDEILSKIREVLKTVQKAHCSIIISILSHGIEGSVYGSNCIPVEIRDIKNEIYQHTENLLGKPKILIVQACQGPDLQISKKVVDYLESDSPATVMRTVSIPPCSDFLIAWSTVEGFASLRHTINGTWFIQTLCETINQNYKEKHLIDILTNVTNKISQMKGNQNESMIPKIESTFRKNLFFVGK